MQTGTFSLAAWIIAPALVAAAAGVASTAVLLGGVLNGLGAESLFLGTLPVFLLPIGAQCVLLRNWDAAAGRSFAWSALAALLVQVAIAGLVRLDELFDLAMLGMRGAGALSGLLYWWLGAVITASIVSAMQSQAIARVLPGRFAVRRVAVLGAIGTIVAIVAALLVYLLAVEAMIPRVPGWLIWLLPLPAGSALAWAIYLMALGLEIRKRSAAIDRMKDAASVQP